MALLLRNHEIRGLMPLSGTLRLLSPGIEKWVWAGDRISPGEPVDSWGPR